MKKTLTLLVTSTALTAAIGVPAWSAMHMPAGGDLRPVAALFDEDAQAMPLILASDDDDEREYRRGSYDDDDYDDDDYDDDDYDDDDYDDDDYEDDDDCDDDDDYGDDDDCGGGANDPAPAGTAAPPQNGLFGNGSSPQVQTK